MTNLFKNLIIAFIAVTILSCNHPNENNAGKQSIKDTTAIAKKDTPQYKAIKFADDFIKTNNDAIKKNTALKEQYEALCTKQILPLIDKKGLYDDLPFELVATSTNNDVPYGNFVYEDDHYFIKVTCILKKSQLENLEENSKYLIKFKVVKFEDAVSFEGETGKVELPVPDAYLRSFIPIKK